MSLPGESKRYPHLLLYRHAMNPDRRKQPSPSPPSGRPRQQAAAQIAARLTELEQEQARQHPPTPGLRGHLVFHVPLSETAPQDAVADALQKVGATIVSYEPDRAVIAFYEDANLIAFRGALQEYSAGPRAGVNPRTGEPYQSSKWDVFGYIEAGEMRNWSRQDRIGPRLRERIDADGSGIERTRLYYLDVEFWPRGAEQARRDLEDLRELLLRDPQDGEWVHDEFAGELMCLARVAITGAKLDDLLNSLVVAEVDCPPQPTFTAATTLCATPDQFPIPAAPPENGPRLCVVDSGIASNHPLLRNHVGHEEAILTATDGPADAHGHGTRVAGVAVFGDVRGAYEAGVFQSDVTLFSARVLNDRSEFNERHLVERQMEQAIRAFHAPPHNCRVFNLSVGENRPLLQAGNHRQGRWAEVLDVLARELQVLIVVSAGNQFQAHAYQPDEAEQVLTTYPGFLFCADAGLCNPATATIAVTVGSVAQYDVPAHRQGAQQHDIRLPIAARNQPSPFTRIGPGVNGAIKPEFADYGGNYTFAGVGSSIRRTEADAGVAVMSLSHQPLQQLFGYDAGTSYAAPRVSRLAAKLWVHLRDTLEVEPRPNLVRALLASSAEAPEEARALLGAHGGETTVRRVCGYGLPDEDQALNSTGRRVTLVAQATQQIDTLTLWEVPIPPEFIEARGPKRIVVALAFDPPVRRRRASYLGVELRFDLLRGRSPAEIEAAYRAITRDEREAAPRSFQDRHVCGLEPGPRALEASTLQRREWSFRRGRVDDGETYYLMIRSYRKWAPAEITHQDYAVAVTLEADDDRLYTLISQRARLRPRIRV